MNVKLIAFGEIEIDGQRYNHDVVIDRGQVRKRGKKPSRQYCDEFGHTPLSVAEEIPWAGARLIVGTGTQGRLPVMADVYREADLRGVELVVVPTAEACHLLSASAETEALNAVLHITC